MKRISGPQGEFLIQSILVVLIIIIQVPVDPVDVEILTPLIPPAILRIRGAALRQVLLAGGGGGGGWFCWFYRR